MNPTPSQPMPEPPEGYRLIPREYLEAGNALPEDALFTGPGFGGWCKSGWRGQPIGAREDITDLFYVTRTPAPEAVTGEPTDPPGLKGGPGRQAKLVREYLGKFHVQGDNPPVIVAENGEALLSMMWPIHEQTPEGEKAAEEYTKALANRIANALNTSPPVEADKDAEDFMGPHKNCEKMRKKMNEEIAERDAALTTTRATIAERDQLISELVVALSELRELVRGECPSLLSEDSGGDGGLEISITAALAHAAEGKEQA